MIKKKYSGKFLMSALGPGFTAGLEGVKIGSNGWHLFNDLCCF